MHGVGLKAVNALSERLIAEVRRDGHLWRQAYARGERTSDLINVRPISDTESTGTTVTFYPDAEIFPGIHDEFAANYGVLSERCRYLAYILHGTTIHLRDERVTPLPRETTFSFEGGLESLVRKLNDNRTPLHTIISGVKSVPFSIHGILRGVIELEFAFQYTDDEHTTELLFVNTLQTSDDGTHQAGLRTALTRTINKWARETKFFQTDDAKFKGDHTLRGLTAVVSIKHPNPYFESMTKVKLLNSEVNTAVASAIAAEFMRHLESNPEQGRRLLDHFRRVTEHSI